MPLDCPIPFGLNRLCKECCHYWNWGDEESCRYYMFEPVPMREILTAKEYAEYLLDKEDKEIYQPVKRHEYEQLKGQTIYLQSKLNNHLDKKNKYNKYI